MREKEREQIERLYRKYRNKLIVHIFRFTGDWDSANEGVQEVFRVACEKRDILFSAENQIAWLKQIAKNIALNILKKQQQRETRLLSLEDIPEDYRPFMIDGELAAIEDDILNERFSKEDQELLHQIYIEGLPYDTVAERHGLSVSACRKRVERLRRHVKREIKKK